MDFCVFVCVCSVSSPSALVIKLIDFLIVPLHSERDEPCDAARLELGERWKKIDFFFCVHVFYISISIFSFYLLQ